MHATIANNTILLQTLMRVEGGQEFNLEHNEKIMDLFCREDLMKYFEEHELWGYVDITEYQEAVFEAGSKSVLNPMAPDHYDEFDYVIKYLKVMEKHQVQPPEVMWSVISNLFFSNNYYEEAGSYEECMRDIDEQLPAIDEEGGQLLEIYKMCMPLVTVNREWVVRALIERSDLWLDYQGWLEELLLSFPDYERLFERCLVNSNHRYATAVLQKVLSKGYRSADSNTVEIAAHTSKISSECSDLLYSYNIQCEIFTKVNKVGRHEYKVSKHMTISYCAQVQGPQERHVVYKLAKYRDLILYNPVDGLEVVPLKAKWQKMQCK